jgi:tRNA 2-thiouridine synthesizing protein A
MNSASLDGATPGARELVDDLERLAGRRCHSCPRTICGHEVLFSVALGCKDAPRCLGCLARGLQRPADELRDQLRDHFRGRDCYGLAWSVACEREGSGPADPPPCLVSPAESSAGVADPPPPGAGGSPLDRWDAGDLACGDLVLALRRRLAELPPGGVLEVIALDPAAPEDLPAWCRLTGHVLRQARHPHYHIQRKGG